MALAKVSIMEQLHDVHLDALQEICNIGMGHAATALSQMIGQTVNLNVPKVTLASLDQVPDIMGGAEQVVVGIYMRIYGNLRGNILLIFPRSPTDLKARAVSSAEDWETVTTLFMRLLTMPCMVRKE